MKVKKAKPKVVKAKPTKAKPKVDKNKKKKVEPKPKKLDPLRAEIVYRTISETLQNTSFGGEFDLPSILTRQLEKSHPDYKLGLHRAYYIPITQAAPFYEATSSRAMNLFQIQAGIVLPAIVGESIPRKLHEFDPPLCKEHE